MELQMILPIVELQNGKKSLPTITIIHFSFVIKRKYHNGYERSRSIGVFK